MPTIAGYLTEAFRALGPKPDEKTATRDAKKGFSERMSQVLALAFAQELRDRGMAGARPTSPGETEGSGAERRMEGGIGAKKVDVTWATEEAGLIAGMSVKTINWPDPRTRNYQKNLANRRGDMLFESVTLHRRFPYAVLFGFFCLDAQAKHDGTTKRKCTFLNAHDRLRLFTGRTDPAGRDEQLERLYVVLHDPNPFQPTIMPYEAGKPEAPLEWSEVFNELVRRVTERNPDTWEEKDGKLRKVMG